jgi:probable DNA metabolism protein
MKIIDEFFEISASAYHSFVYAWMSGFPIEADMIRFAWRVIDSARSAAALGKHYAQTAARRAGEKAAVDRGDPSVRTVMAAAFKVSREVERLMGMLRFSPDGNGVYTARCSPDHYCLPVLARHFEGRFGNTPWAVIDEKRRICLFRFPPAQARLAQLEEFSAMMEGAGKTGAASGNSAGEVPWEDVWRTYHRVINNESRKNLCLQRQFMPLRYWKYLPEL